MHQICRVKNKFNYGGRGGGAVYTLKNKKNYYTFAVLDTQLSTCVADIRNRQQDAHAAQCCSAGIPDGAETHLSECLIRAVTLSFCPVFFLLDILMVLLLLLVMVVVLCQVNCYCVYG